MSAGRAYLRFELLRAVRNRRFTIFSFGFPLVLYFLIAIPSKGSDTLAQTGIDANRYFMVSVSSFGTMTAMLSLGARLSAERQTGWNRQLRISPLSVRDYFRTKVVIAYITAAVSLLMLYAAGLSMGVRMPAGDWLRMTGLILVALLPFAALGIMLGHLVPADSTGPMMGGLTGILALVSGTWFPIGDHGFLHDIAQFLPSYYLVEAGRIGVGGAAWGAKGWAVVAVWTIVVARLARLAYARDTGKG